jgi:Flp pilus assembly protein TadG
LIHTSRSRERNSNRALPVWGNARGATLIYVLVLIGVLFGFMSLAIDLGRIYVIQGELQTAADAGALAAAMRLNGTANSATHAADQFATTFDTTSLNDNRFNLGLSQIGIPGTTLTTEISTDYFATVADARLNTNGGQTGDQARYVRAEVRAEAPVSFARLLSAERGPTQTVVAAAVAGIGGPLCAACGIDALAVVAVDPADTEEFGFTLNENYTLYMNPAQQFVGLGGCQAGAPAPQLDTIASVQYVLLNHLSGAASADAEEELFRLGAGGASSRTDLDPTGCVLIGSQEALLADQLPPVCNNGGRDFICGLNTRFGVDFATNTCTNVPNIDTLAPLFSADSDVGDAAVLQEYTQDYDGSVRRVLTVAVVDAADTLNVLGFRQFFMQNSPTIAGLGPIQGAVSSRAAFRAQYIGAPVPIRSGTAAGTCAVTRGVGRTVLH